ncbi:MAG TPA: MmcQ/YjbR family DNA-binding protein [Gammaproteobacteria bacterium]
MRAAAKKNTIRRRRPTFDDVRKIALSMPEVEETTGYGMPWFKAGKTRFAGEPVPRRDVEPRSIGVGVSFEDRDRLIASRPEVYYVTEHFAPYPAVLARLTTMSLDELRELLALGWHYAMERQTAKKTRRKK